LEISSFSFVNVLDGLTAAGVQGHAKLCRRSGDG